MISNTKGDVIDFQMGTHNLLLAENIELHEFGIVWDGDCRLKQNTSSDISE